MTIHREKEGIAFECDDCEEIEQTSTSSFSEALEQVQSEGWTKTQVRPGVWEHYCRHCS